MKKLNQATTQPKQQVSSKNKGKVPLQKKQSTKPWSEAILNKPAPGKTFAEMLRQVHCNVRLNASGANIKALRKTRSGDVLVELGPGSMNKAQFGNALCSTVGDSTKVCCIEPKVTLDLQVHWPRS